MAGLTIKSSVDFAGDFFTKDPNKTFSDNVRDLLNEAITEIADDVRSNVAAGEGSRAPIHALGGARVSQFIKGRVAALSGKPWHYNAVVSPDTSGLDAKGATALLAAASRIEGQTRAFRRAASATRRQKTNLTKGIE
jgi:hypothetical protein